MDLNLYYNLVKYLSDLIYPESSTDEEQRKIRSQSKYFIVREGILYKKNRKNPQRPLWVVKMNEVEIILHNLQRVITGFRTIKKPFTFIYLY